jgi:hypothetical protein
VPYPQPLNETLVRRFGWETSFSIPLADKAIKRGDLACAAGIVFRCVDGRTDGPERRTGSLKWSVHHPGCLKRLTWSRSLPPRPARPKTDLAALPLSPPGHFPRQALHPHQRPLRSSPLVYCLYVVPRGNHTPGDHEQPRDSRAPVGPPARSALGLSSGAGLQLSAPPAPQALKRTPSSRCRVLFGSVAIGRIAHRRPCGGSSA